MLTQNHLKILMRHYIAAISSPPDDTWEDISEDVIHKNVLPEGGFGTATPRRIYKATIRYALIVNGHPDKSWPANWLDLSVKALAQKLIN